jgi:hypothetical protein
LQQRLERLLRSLHLAQRILPEQQLPVTRIALALAVLAATAAGAPASALDLSSQARREVLDQARHTAEEVGSVADASIADLDAAALELANGEIGTIEYSAEAQDAADDVAPDLSELAADAAEDLAEIAAEEVAEFGTNPAETVAAVNAYYDALLDGAAPAVTPRLATLIARLQTARLGTVTVSPAATAAIDAAIAGAQSAPMAP